MVFKYKVKEGDTLNAIAQKHGFANYKKAGIISVPSGNFDLIRPGEEITLNNYDPNVIKPITETPLVISSKDVAEEHKSLTSSLDKKLNPPIEAPTTTPTIDNNGVSVIKPDETTTMPKSSGDIAYDKMLETEKTGIASAEKWATDKKAEISALLPKTLALLDAQYASSVTNITNTYNKLITEQKRINQVNIDRTKAYGLSAGGQYMPLEFTNAISEQEQKAANEISSLESSRNDLLAKAKQARDEGEISTLRENMDAINKVEETMRQRTKDLADEVQKRYELTVQVRKEQEAKHLKEVATSLEAVKYKYLKDFQNAKEEEDKVKVIRKIILNSAGILTDKDFYSIYSILSGAVETEEDKIAKRAKEEAELKYKKAQTEKEEAGIKTKEERELEIEKTKEEIKSLKSLTTQRNASAAKDWADAAEKTKEKKIISDMKEAINAIQTPSEKEKQTFVKKFGSDGRKYWDDVFKDDTGLYNYENAKGKTNNKNKTDKSKEFRDKYKY